jgi:hypothetical protein
MGRQDEKRVDRDVGIQKSAYTTGETQAIRFRRASAFAGVCDGNGFQAGTIPIWLPKGLLLYLEAG